ncbi:FKBP-type peptidyl-prolyl cis-trans isomerase 2 [Bacteroidales bacterium 6E]|nr:FKBP-type peptidyl-prolyl cis-trans isomerase 2 [Bacteroidales bacterium 6E]
MMEIAKNRMVTLTYDLRLDDQNGDMIEQATADRPLQFIYGAGQMLPKFEAQLAGLKQGQNFQISLTKFDAYGEVNDDAIVELPLEVFMVDGNFDNDLVKIGNTVPMMTGDGQRLNGIVLEVSDEFVKMDFNHPLAGEDLHFDGEIIEVRDASDEEIAALFSNSGCGCGSGGCGGGECDTHDHDHEHHHHGGGGCGCNC